MNKTQKILTVSLIVVAVVAIGLLARFVVFKKQFDAWGQGLERIGTWQENYKKEHPNATQADMDKDFDNGMAGLKVWKDKYQAEHPNATDVEIDTAFNAQWNK